MADIDKDSPGDSSLISQYPQNERDSRSAIEDILAVDHEAGSDTADDGKHTIVQLLAQSTVSGVAGQGALYTKDVGSGVIELFHKDESGNEVQITKRGANQSFPSGTNMLFHQSSAPTGWTQDTSVNDRVLRVVDGNGGGTGGSWTISGVTVDGHQLTNAEMPSHNHGGSTGNGGNHRHSVFLVEDSNTQTIHGILRDPAGNANDVSGGYFDTVSDFDSTTNMTDSGSHNHGIGTDGSDNSHSHGLTADGNWRPAHADVIAATKD